MVDKYIGSILLTDEEVKHTEYSTRGKPTIF